MFIQKSFAGLKTLSCVGFAEVDKFVAGSFCVVGASLAVVSCSCIVAKAQLGAKYGLVVLLKPSCDSAFGLMSWYAWALFCVPEKLL